MHKDTSEDGKSCIELEYDNAVSGNRKNSMMGRLRRAWNSKQFELPQDDSLFEFWKNLTWHTAISHRWKHSTRRAHINCLEREALILAVRHQGSRRFTRGKRICIFMDSTVVLGAPFVRAEALQNGSTLFVGGWRHTQLCQMFV